MTIDYLLDANIVSALINRPDGIAARRLDEVGIDAVATSVVVSGEVRFGYVRKASRRLTEAAQAVLGAIEILPLGPPADERYAELRAELERKGTPIGANDMLIAAHALALDCTLVTANEREFRRVPGLRVENWLA